MYEWVVITSTGAARRHRADRFDILKNGDLVFMNEHGEYIRAYAAGTWSEISLYA